MINWVAVTSETTMADKGRESRLVCRNVELFSVVEHAPAYSLSFLSGVFPVRMFLFW